MHTLSIQIVQFQRFRCGFTCIKGTSLARGSSGFSFVFSASTTCHKAIFAVCHKDLVLAHGIKMTFMADPTPKIDTKARHLGLLFNGWLRRSLDQTRHVPTPHVNMHDNWQPPKHLTKKLVGHKASVCPSPFEEAPLQVDSLAVEV